MSDLAQGTVTIKSDGATIKAGRIASVDVYTADEWSALVTKPRGAKPVVKDGKPTGEYSVTRAAKPRALVLSGDVATATSKRHGTVTVPRSALPMLAEAAGVDVALVLSRFPADGTEPPAPADADLEAVKSAMRTLIRHASSGRFAFGGNAESDLAY